MMRRLLAIATLALAVPALAGQLEVEFTDGTTVAAERNRVEGGRYRLTLLDGTTMDVPAVEVSRIRFVFDPVEPATPPAEAPRVDVRWEPEEGYEPRLAGAEFAPSRFNRPPVPVRWEPDEGQAPAWRWSPGQGIAGRAPVVRWWRPQDGFDRE